MQAENTHSRQKRQRLWYQRDGFLWGLVAALIAAAWGLLPPAGTSLGIGGWLGMGLYMLLAAVPMIVTTMDKRRPQVAGTAAALGFLGFFGFPAVLAVMRVDHIAFDDRIRAIGGDERGKREGPDERHQDADGRDEIVQREIHKRDNENADNRHQVAFNTQQRKDQRVFDDLDQR